MATITLLRTRTCPTCSHRVAGPVRRLAESLVWTTSCCHAEVGDRWSATVRVDCGCTDAVHRGH